MRVKTRAIANILVTDVHQKGDFMKKQLQETVLPEHMRVILNSIFMSCRALGTVDASAIKVDITINAIQTSNVSTTRAWIKSSRFASKQSLNRLETWTSRRASRVLQICATRVSTLSVPRNPSRVRKYRAMLSATAISRDIVSTVIKTATHTKGIKIARNPGSRTSAKKRVTTASLKNSKRARFATRVMIALVRTRTRLATQSVMAIARDMQPTVVTTALVIKTTVGVLRVTSKSGCDPSAQEPAGSARVLRLRRRTLTHLQSTSTKMEITKNLAAERTRNAVRAFVETSFNSAKRKDSRIKSARSAKKPSNEKTLCDT